MSFLNRRELEDKGQIGEEPTMNCPELPPIGMGERRDVAGRAEEDHECKVLKGLASIGSPRVTGTERWEPPARSLRGAGGGRGTQQPPLVAAWFPELVTGPPWFHTSALSVANWGGERKILKTESCPQPRDMSNRSIFYLSPKDRGSFTQ